jgi:putative effector of murein hydrolase
MIRFFYKQLFYQNTSTPSLNPVVFSVTFMVTFLRASKACSSFSYISVYTAAG